MKLSKKMSVLLFVLSAPTAYSVSYVPLPIERQVKESKGVAQIVILQSSSKKLPSGQIVTEYWAELEKFSGDSNSIDKHSFSFLVPGGKIGEEGVYIPGGPEFKKGENALVFLRNSKDGSWLQNLGVGKYEVRKIGNKVIYVSSVFPYHPTMGQIEEGELNRLLRSHWGTGLVPVHKMMNINTTIKNETIVLRDLPSEKKRLDRKIASLDELDEDQAKDDSKWGIFWLISLLAGLGGLTQILSKKKRL